MGEGAEELFFGNGELPLVCRPGETLYCHVWHVSRCIFMHRIQIRRDILRHSTPNTDFQRISQEIHLILSTFSLPKSFKTIFLLIKQSVKYMERCARASRITSNTEYVSNRSHREKVCLKRSTLLIAPNHKIRLCCPGATLYCHVWQVSRSIFMRRIQIRRDILWHSTPNTDFEHKTRKWFFGFCLSELIFFC